ncbi:MAG: molybdopterin-binding protein [Deltaproteobacteria bacterium]|nr:molybdopterin-binding protein [Deltaproteobacteria bacterium]
MVHVLPLQAAIGTVLAHDITEIVPGRFKGRAFRKGHVVTRADIDHLRDLGKEHLYVLKISDIELHEDEAALRLASALAGDGIEHDCSPKEGKVELRAADNGLLKIDVAALYRFNLLGDVMCATRHDNTVVKKGDRVAGTRAISLVIPLGRVEQAESICRGAGGILKVLPLRKAHVGVVITGNEVYSGRIRDRFRPVVEGKVEELGSEVVDVRYVPDRREAIAQSVRDLLDQGADLILATGGMSVDPDDVTCHAIEDAGADPVIYGASVLPGAMLMVAYIGEVPVIGIPACAMFHSITLFDLLFPRILAGERIGREQIAALGHGGFCINCPECRFPVCPFGK